MDFYKKDRFHTAFVEIFLKSISPLFIYTGLSLVFFGKAANWTQWVCGQGQDALQFIWFLSWWPFAVGHGLNPFVSHFVWFPHGANFTWDTSVPSAALLGLPVTLLGGPVLAFNVLTLMAPALSAWAAFFLTRYLTRALTHSWAAALFGGYLYGFSSYEFGHLLGHLNLDLTFLVPLAVLTCICRVRKDIGRKHFIMAMAAIFLFELGLSSEILATLCVLGALSWAAFLIFAPEPDRADLWQMARDVVLAGLATIVLAAPFLFYLVKGLADVPNTINPPSIYSADPLNYLIPTILTHFGKTLFAPVAQQFTGNGSEQGAYLGLPLLLIMLLYFRDQLARPYVKALLATTILLVTASLGPWLHLGSVQTKIPLPWLLFDKLPLIRSALPTRFTQYVSLAAAITAALYLATPGIGRWQIGRFLAVGVSCLLLLPNTDLYPWIRWPEQPFFSAENVHQALGDHANVIILPFSPDSLGTSWQLDAGMRFTQSGGYVGFVPASQQQFPVVAALATGTVNPDFANDLNAYCATHRVDYILITLGTPAPLIQAVAAQNWPQRWDHGIIVVKVPPPETLNYHLVLGDYWPSAAPQNWMGRQIRVATGAQAATLTLKGTGYLPAPVHITADWGSGTSNYAIGPDTVQVIALPANTIVTLTADQTFVPNKILHNRDRRHLSVLISVK